MNRYISINCERKTYHILSTTIKVKKNGIVDSDSGEKKKKTLSTKKHMVERDDIYVSDWWQRFR